MYKFLINLHNERILSYFLINNQLEFVIEDDIDGLEYAIFNSKIIKYNANNSLAWINYQDDKFGVLNLPQSVKVQTGSSIIAQMVRAANNTKLAKFSTKIKLIGKYVIIYPFKTNNDNDKLFDLKLIAIKQQYPQVSIVFRSCVATISDYNLIIAEIDYLLESITTKTTSPAIIYSACPKYLQLICNVNCADNLTIEVNDNTIFNQLYKLQHLYNFKLSFSNIDLQLKSLPIEANYNYIEMHNLSGINLFDVNSGNANLNSYKVNLLAINEIVRAVKQNDLCGIILIDFIKNQTTTEQQNLINELKRQLSNDWRNHKFFSFTAAGIFEFIRFN